MAKPGTNKERCKRYTASGHKETNKEMRQKRNQKRIARFAARKAAGKSYTYKPNPYDPIKQKRQYLAEADERAQKNVDHRDTISRMRSIMRKLQNKLDREALMAKKTVNA